MLRRQARDRLVTFLAEESRNGDPLSQMTVRLGNADLREFESYFEEEDRAWRSYPYNQQVRPTRMSVSDFGAVGDGVSDESAAFGKALSAIRALGGRPSVLEIPKGRYLLRSPARPGMGDAGGVLVNLDASGLTNCVIEGHSMESTEIIFGSYQASGVSLARSWNSTLRKVHLHYAETPFCQGTVRAFNKKERWAEIKREPSTLKPTDPRFRLSEFSQKTQCCGQFDSSGKKMYSVPNVFFNLDAEDLGDDVFRVHFSEHPAFPGAEMPVGSILVIPDRDNRFAAVHAPRSRLCNFEEVRVSNSRAGAFTVSGGWMVTGWKCEVSPLNRGLVLSTNADAFFNSRGTHLAHCHFHHMNDDAANSLSVGATILSISEDRRTVVHRAKVDRRRKGDLVVFIRPTDGRYLCVMEIAESGWKTIDGVGYHTETFTEPIPDGVLSNESVGGREMTASERARMTRGFVRIANQADQVYFPMAFGVGYVVYDNDFHDIRNLGVQVQCPNALVISNRIARVSGGIHLSCLTTWAEGPAPYNVLVRGNRLDELENAVCTTFGTVTGRPAVDDPYRGICIEDNAMNDIAAKVPIRLENCKGACVKGNTLDGRPFDVKTGTNPLLDFSTANVVWDVMAGAYRPEFAAEQLVRTDEGLVVRTDRAKEARSSKWLTLDIPRNAGTCTDWSGRLVALVMPRPPSGRMMSNIALNFSDREEEVFQFFAVDTHYNDRGEFVLVYDLQNMEGVSSWGGKPADGRLDSPVRLGSVSIHFGAGDTGEVVLSRVENVAREAVPQRETMSREPISTDTMYPGAEPFPGAERLVFRVAGEVPEGTLARLVLSHDSISEAPYGKKDEFRSVVSNGIVRFATHLPYTTHYQFLSLSSPRGDLRIAQAAGEFLQSEAETMRLDCETGNPLHICRAERDERPVLIVRNPAARPIIWKTTFVLSDYFGRTVGIPFDRAVKAGETVRLAVPWPLPAKGLWRVKAEVEAGDGSRAVKETRFGYIDLHEVTPKVEKPKFRMGIHYHGTRYWPNKVDLTIAALVASGAKFTRCDYDHMWSDIENPQGVYHWEKSDAMIDKLTSAGFALDIIFASFPAWAVIPEVAKRNDALRAKGVRMRNCANLPRPGLFRDFCEMYARRYGTRIDYYECGNEWDLTNPESVAHDDLLRLQREAYEGLHAGCPDVCVIPNGWGMAASHSAVPSMFNKGLIEHFAQHPETYDVWAFHSHRSFDAFQVDVDDRFLPLRASTPLRTRKWLLNETALTSHCGQEDEVARHVWMKILFGWSRGAQDYNWYNLRATGWFDGGEPGYGLITPDYRPRAGYAAFAALTTIFQGLDFDSSIHSRKQRHVFRFKGRSQGADGVVIAGWDSQVRRGVRRIGFRTDAKRACLVDLMGNRTEAAQKDGEIVFPLAYQPQALVLEGATMAEPIDRAVLESETTDAVLVSAVNLGDEPIFVLDGVTHVKNLYEANPVTAYRLWSGPGDLSARFWLSSSEGGVRVRAAVRDDKAHADDSIEFSVTSNGSTRMFRLRPSRRDGTMSFYDQVLPVADRSFGLNIHVLDDDGEGVDGYLFLRSETEDPLQVIFE